MFVVCLFIDKKKSPVTIIFLILGENIKAIFFTSTDNEYLSGFVYMVALLTFFKEIAIFLYIEDP